MAVTPALSMFLLLTVVALLPRGSSAAESGASTLCVCKQELPAAALQRTLDYACGHGADCAQLLPGGQCHSDTDTVGVRCSYAANSYYSNAKAKAGGGRGATCDFGGTATLTSTDPSSGTCKYPAAATAGEVDSATAATTTTVLLFLLAIISISLSMFCYLVMHEETQRCKARRRN